MKNTPLPMLFLLLAATVTAYAAPLTLTDALAKRAAGSRTLKMVALDEQIAGDNVRASRSTFFPRIDIQGGYTAQQAPQAIAMPQGSFETQQADYAFLALSLNQTIYDFGRAAARVSHAEAGREAARFSYKIEEQELFLRTVTSYFRILKEQKFLDAADEESKQMQDHLRVARNLFEQGVATRNDLLQAGVRLASSSQRLLESANRLENCWLDFNNQLGESPDFRAELQEGTTIDLAALERPADEVVTTRAELLLQQKSIDAADSAVREARTGYYPELYARLGLDYVQNEKMKEQAIYSATVGLKMNLFDGFATTSRYRQAVKNRSRNEERLLQLKSDLALEYRIAVNDVKVARQRIAVTEAAIRQGEENLRINRDRYAEKVGTATDVIDAQTLLTQTRVDYYTALYDYQVALARVKKARGEL